MVRVCFANRAIHCCALSEVSWIRKDVPIPLRTYPYPISACGWANPIEPPVPGAPNELGEPKGIFGEGFVKPSESDHSTFTTRSRNPCSSATGGAISCRSVSSRNPISFPPVAKTLYAWAMARAVPTPLPKELQNSWRRHVLCPRNANSPTVLCGTPNAASSTREPRR
jgi:hypothetical protein